MTPPGEKFFCGCPAGGGRRRSTRHRPLVTDYHLPRTSRCSSHSRCARGLVACDGAHRITWTCSPQRRPTCHVTGSSASSGSTPHARPPPSLPLPARTCPWRYVVVVGESAHHRGRPRRAIRLPGPTYDRSAAATLDLATGPCSTDANERDTVQSLLAHAASITIGTPVRQRGGTVARPTPPREGVTSGGEVSRVVS